MKLSRELFLQNIQGICQRPQMYTKSGTFWEALAFIQGIALGSGAHGFEGSHAGIQDFFGWLEKKVGNHPDFQWWSIESFHAMYSDDETALKAFAEYYGEFCNEIPDEEDEIELQITESKAKELFEHISREEKFFEIQEKIKENLWQNSNHRKVLNSE